MRAEQEERIGRCLRLGDQQRALPEVVQHQARQHEEQPCGADRFPAEVTHVGIQRLGAGHAQHDRAEHDEGQQPVMQAEGRGVAG